MVTDGPTTERWRIELLGGLRVARGERVITRFRTQKTGALLSFLAYHGDRPHARDGLIELFWPRRNLASGRNSLSHALSSLRRQLEPPGIARGSVIVTDHYHVRLNPVAATTDVRDLEGALDRAKRADGDERETLLRDAVALYRGDLLAGSDEPWLARERERLRAAFTQAARSLAAIHRSRGAWEPAIVLLRRAVEASRLDEPLHRDLMELLADSGQPLAVARHYQELARTFKREVSRPPSPETRELARRLETEARTAPRPLAPGGDPVGRATPLPGGTITFLLAAGALEAGGAGPGEILAPLLGQHAGEQVRSEGGRVLAAFGRPSDALACALACRRVAAAPLRLVLDTCEVAAAEPAGDRVVPEQAERILGAAGAGHLLCSEATAVLLRQSAAARPIDMGLYRLPPGASAVRIFQVRDGEGPDPPLAAERAPNPSLPLELGRFFGREEELARLRQELGGGRRLVTITGAGGMGKTRLALQAARDLLETFRGAVWFVPLAEVIDARDLPRALADALRLPPAPGLDAWTRAAEELSKRPTLLVLDNFEQIGEGGAERVRSLLERADALSCLVTSRQRLGLEGERELNLEPLPAPLPEDDADPERLVTFASVRLFVERAQAVRPDFQVTRAAARSVALLVRRLEGIPLALALAGGRAQAFSLEQILARLSDRLDLLASRSREAPARHRTLRAAIEWSHALLSPGQQRLFARLSVFRGGFSIESAREVCEEPGALDAIVGLRECSLISQDREAAEPRFRMLETLREYAREQLPGDALAELERRHAEHFRGFAERAASHLEGRSQGEWLDRLTAEQDNLRAALEWSRSSPSRSEAELALCASLWRSWMIRGPQDEGRRWCAEALGRSRGATPSRLGVLVGASTLASHRGDHAAARSLASELLALSRELGDRPRIARSLVQVGNVAMVSGDVREARLHHEASLALARELGDTHLISGELHNLGHLMVLQGEYRAGRAYFEESLGVATELEPMKRALTLCELGRALVFLGDGGARARLEEALGAFQTLGYRLGSVTALRNLAVAAEREGDREGAHALLERSLAEVRSTDTWAAAARALSLAGLARVASQEKESLDLAERALALARENVLMREYVLGCVLRDVGDLRRGAGDSESAREAYEEALEHLGALDEKAHACSCLEGLAALDQDEGEERRAAELLAAAAARREDAGAMPSRRERSRLDAARSALVRALGRRAFDRAWRDGTKLTLGEATARARDTGRA